MEMDQKKTIVASATSPRIDNGHRIAEHPPMIKVSDNHQCGWIAYMSVRSLDLLLTALRRRGSGRLHGWQYETPTDPAPPPGRGVFLCRIL